MKIREIHGVTELPLELTIVEIVTKIFQNGDSLYLIKIVLIQYLYVLNKNVCV